MFWSILRFPYYLYNIMFKNNYTVVLHMENGQRIYIRNVYELNGDYTAGKLTKLSMKYYLYSSGNKVVYYDVNKIVAITTK